MNTLFLTSRATCLMNLEDFPMDRQRCPLRLGSCQSRQWCHPFHVLMMLFKTWPAVVIIWQYNFASILVQNMTDLMTILPVGYTTADVVYQWTAGRGVNIASDMKLSQVSFSTLGGQLCFCFKLSFLSLFVTSSLPKKIIILNYGCNVHSQFFIKTMQHKKFKLAEHSLQSLRQCVFSVRARLQCVFLVWPDQLANTITKIQL